MMNDRLHPPLSTFTLTPQQSSAVTEALTHPKPWKHEDKSLKHIEDLLVEVKALLKEIHLERQGHACCYCRAIMFGGGRFTIDREHILPKSKYKEFSYAPENLSVSCKRCNMEYKGEEDDFVIDPDTIRTDHKNPLRYKLIHPNFDVWKEHLTRHCLQVNDGYIVWYQIQSPKGQYTFDYFGLIQLSVDTFDEAQGIEPLPDPLISLYHEIARLKATHTAPRQIETQELRT